MVLATLCEMQIEHEAHLARSQQFLLPSRRWGELCPQPVGPYLSSIGVVTVEGLRVLGTGQIGSVLEHAEQYRWRSTRHASGFVRVIGYGNVYELVGDIARDEKYYACILSGATDQESGI